VADTDEDNLTNQSTHLPSQSGTSGFSWLRPSRAARFMIAGIVVLPPGQNGSGETEFGGPFGPIRVHVGPGRAVGEGLGEREIEPEHGVLGDARDRRLHPGSNQPVPQRLGGLRVEDPGLGDSFSWCEGWLRDGWPRCVIGRGVEIPAGHGRVTVTTPRRSGGSGGPSFG
jgi:hypothetical protein